MRLVQYSGTKHWYKNGYICTSNTKTEVNDINKL